MIGRVQGVPVALEAGHDNLHMQVQRCSDESISCHPSLTSFVKRRLSIVGAQATDFVPNIECKEALLRDHFFLESSWA
jgi:hypothetical protein